MSDPSGDTRGTSGDQPAEADPDQAAEQPAGEADSSSLAGAHRARRRPAGLTRRALLGAGVVVVAGGVGAGIAAGQPRHRPEEHRPSAPAELHAALDRELSLLAGLDAALHATPAPGAPTTVLRAARADHTAHATALRSAIVAYPAPAASNTSPTAPLAAAPTVAQLRAAEIMAGRTAAGESAALTGADAALLASIAACEATHAELLA